MTTNLLAGDELQENKEAPGITLAKLRESKGYSQEYVAGKLHLRVKVIESIEDDNYAQLPEPVFIKGYLRAYAKLIGMPHEPLLKSFNDRYVTEKKVEKALWQGRREPKKKEKTLRIVTVFIVIAAFSAVGIWWQKTNDEITVEKVAVQEKKPVEGVAAPEKLTALTKMQSMFTLPSEESIGETASG